MKKKNKENNGNKSEVEFISAEFSVSRELPLDPNLLLTSVDSFVCHFWAYSPSRKRGWSVEVHPFLWFRESPLL